MALVLSPGALVLGAGFGCWCGPEEALRLLRWTWWVEQWKNTPVSVTKYVFVPRQMVRTVALSGGFLERCFLPVRQEG